jgi:hypothetical protein
MAVVVMTSRVAIKSRMLARIYDGTVGEIKTISFHSNASREKSRQTYKELASFMCAN